MKLTARPTLERLEDRIAPAGLVIAASGRQATYTDVDGDTVVVKVSKGQLTAANFTFANLGLGQQLQLLDLRTETPDEFVFADADVTVTATPSALGGDGFAAVGEVNSTGVFLGDLTIDGDLGRLRGGASGLAIPFPAYDHVTVHSMGRYGVLTQAAGGSLVSQIAVGLQSLTVLTDLVGVTILTGGTIQGTGDSTTVTTPGQITALEVHGSILGGAAQGAGLVATGFIKTLHIGGDLVGGSGALSGTVITATTLQATVEGSLLGGSGYESGTLELGRGSATTKSLKVGGNLLAGSGSYSGALKLFYNVDSITVGRNLFGGSAAGSGSITIATNSANDSGKRVDITVGGSVLGGFSTQTGILSDARLGAVKIGRDVRGISNTSPVNITAAGYLGDGTPGFTSGIDELQIGGSAIFAQVLAGYNRAGQAVNADAQVGPVTIKRDVAATSIAAGVLANGDGFGNANDAVIGTGGLANVSSSIASIKIGGTLYGSSPTGDHYGFSAQSIGSVQLGAGKPAAANGLELAPRTGDVKLRLVGATTTAAPLGTGPGLVVAANGRSATYTDVDGDLVTLKVTKGKLLPSYFTMANTGLGQQLQRLDLTALVNGAPLFAKSSVTFTAKPTALGGDGHVAVGFLNAEAVRLGKVTVPGDLGRIVAGDGLYSLPSLTVGSLGVLGLTSQSSNGTLVSIFSGQAGSVTIHGDVSGASLGVGYFNEELTRSRGPAGPLLTKATIEGSFLRTATQNVLLVEGTLGTLKINGDVFGAAVGAYTLNTVTLDGSLVGGTDARSGTISVGTVGSARVRGDVFGASGPISGTIEAIVAKNIRVDGNLTGGSGAQSGSLLIGGAEAPPSGSLTVGGSVIAGSNVLTGILVEGQAKSITVGHDVRGTTAVRAKIVVAGANQPPSARAALALNQLSIGGSVTFTDVLFGFSTANLSALRDDVMAGSVTVAGDWQASSLAIGVRANNDGFGNPNDTLIASGGAAGITARVASIIIRGDVTGTAGTNDHFGFAAEAIGKLQVGSGQVPLVNGRELAPLTGDVKLRLLG